MTQKMVRIYFDQNFVEKLYLNEWNGSESTEAIWLHLQSHMVFFSYELTGSIPFHNSLGIDMKLYLIVPVGGCIYACRYIVDGSRTPSERLQPTIYVTPRSQKRPV